MTPGPGTTTVPGTAVGRLTVKTTNPRLLTALARGLTVKVTAPAATPITVLARAHGAKVGRGTAHGRPGHAVSVKVTFTKAARRHLRHSHRATIALIIAQGTATKTSKITLHR